MSAYFRCKSVKEKKWSLMEYLIFEIKKNKPEMLDFIAPINDYFGEIMKRNLEDVVKDIMKLKSKFNIL